jgi:N-methylhydantoinase B
VRTYGVILNWGTGELLARTTEQTRQFVHDRAASWWQNGDDDQHG